MKNLALAIIFAGVISAAPVFAQVSVSPSQAVESARQSTMDIKNRSMELDRIRRDAANGERSSGEENQRFPEIKKDFEQIQTINADFLQTPSLKKELDYKTIFKGAIEIRKRAFRLKSNLFPTEETNSDNISIERNSEKYLNQNFKTLAIEVDNALYRFVSNNIFQNIKLVDLKDSQKAKEDLEKIIVLCGAIQTKIKSLEKTN